ncbi:MAG: DNA repair protein RecO [Candidatus Sericytochromatia bacterium]
MERTYSLTAMCLRGYAIKEADKILVLLSREQGLKRVVAKGLRKPKSKIGGRLEPFRENMVMLAKGKNMDLVTQVDSLRAFKGPQADFEAMAAGMAASEVLMAFLEDEDPNPEAYDLYVDFLEALGPGVDASLVLTAFELQLMEILGYRPELGQCLACDRELSAPGDVHGLHVEAGGAICSHCEGLTGGRVRRLRPDTWQMLQALQETPLVAVNQLPVDDPTRAGCRMALKEYMSFRAERELKAQGMFDWQGAVTKV